MVTIRIEESEHDVGDNDIFVQGLTKREISFIGDREGVIPLWCDPNKGSKFVVSKEDTSFFVQYVLWLVETHDDSIGDERDPMQGDYPEVLHEGRL